MTRALLTGWFSVPGGEATAGDLLAADVVRDVLTEAGWEVDAATNEGFGDGVPLGEADPERYQLVVFVCGPLHGDRVARLLDRFPDARKVAVNVSVVDDGLAARFDAVVPREDRVGANPDLALRSAPGPLPLVGVVRAHPQPEYERGRHREVDAAIRLLLASRPCAVVDFDTRVHPAADPLASHARSPAEVTTLARRVDVVVTSRLHGLVLGLRQGTPVVAIDPVGGGAKVARQAAVLDWPAVVTADDLGTETLAAHLSWCLSAEGRDRARTCVGGAERALGAVVDRVRDVIAPPDSSRTTRVPMR